MPDLSHETHHGRTQGRLILGVDEVGRGPLAGPVMAAAVVIPREGLPPDITARINDSKKMSNNQREALFPILTAFCPYAVGQASVEEIDEINILQATFRAMRRAIMTLTESLGINPDHILIDGNRLPDLPFPGSTIVKGDSKSLSIATASIIAKVTRDRLMKNLSESFPVYGWDQNAGYGTAFHMNALKTYGPTQHHRQSFAPIKKLLPI